MQVFRNTTLQHKERKEIKTEESIQDPETPLKDQMSRPGMVARAFNTSTPEIEVSECLWVLGQSMLHSETVSKASKQTNKQRCTFQCLGHHQLTSFGLLPVAVIKTRTKDSSGRKGSLHLTAGSPSPEKVREGPQGYSQEAGTEAEVVRTAPSSLDQPDRFHNQWSSTQGRNMHNELGLPHHH